jgi:uncharacterized membrane protein
MRMERAEKLIGKLMIIGVCLSSLFVLIGCTVYLIKHGHEPAHYEIFHGEPKPLTSFMGIWDNAFTYSGRGIIQFGLLTLVSIQLLRVALTGWLFAQIKDWRFTLISALILCALIYTLMVF